VLSGALGSLDRKALPMCVYVNLLGDKPTAEEFLARLADLKGIAGLVQPMRPIPLVTGPETCVADSWDGPFPGAGS
jgi:hypothetical protein